MGSGFEFFVFYFCCVALCLILSGLYLIIKRFVLRRNGTPVTIVSILPRVIKEIPFVARGMDKYIYGYDIKYILNGETHTAESVEFYIPFAPTSGPMVQFSPTGVLAKNGEVSIDNVTITIEYGAVSIVLGIWIFLGMLDFVR
ncbi:MAG: hypothetical protein E7C34_06245 [Veillonella sp.]|mgnify:FL=1|jgi:conserved domain protein|uniref:hypothetical protein n=1 Tax=Veillonella TaxID=29465 RepID=UPI0029052962|nr:hypothetical protein [Veillonella sp.]MDU2711382.1 hypothetical protein [Veillonella sp.]MDU6063207.1 hypothetical protein [Veillonella sp.]MDU6127908.1 hypothetical protein [Veillonella sp.]